MHSARIALVEQRPRKIESHQLTLMDFHNYHHIVITKTQHRPHFLILKHQSYQNLLINHRHLHSHLPRHFYFIED